MNSKLPTPNLTKQSRSKDQTERTPPSSVVIRTALTSTGERYKPSVRRTDRDKQTPSIPPMRKTSKLISDEERQHAAILRSAANQLLAAGLARKTKSTTTNEVKICFDLDLWTEDLKLTR